MIRLLLRLLFPKKKPVEISPESRAKIAAVVKERLQQKSTPTPRGLPGKAGGTATGRRRKISEQGTPEKILGHLPGSAGEGAAMVGVAMDDPPAKIVAAINAYVSNPPPTPAEVDIWTERALPLGSLWGEQLVREFGWEWSSVTFHEHGDSKATGVFNKNRSLAIYPWHFILGCLKNKAPVTILLAFNMQAADKIPDLEPGEFANVMEGVHHIVPPG